MASTNIILRPSVGHLLVLPQLRDNEVAGIVLAVRDSTLPMGEVIEVGQRPKGYRTLFVKRGDIVYFSQHTAQEIQVVIGGEKRTCRFITYADLRGKHIEHENGILEKGRNVLGVLTSRLAAFGAGFALGAALAPLFGRLRDAWRSVAAKSRPAGQHGNKPPESEPGGTE